MTSTLIILGTPALAASLLLLDAVSPVAAHTALALLAGVVLVGSVVLVRAENRSTEMKKNVK